MSIVDGLTSSGFCDYWDIVPGLPLVRKWSGEKTVLQGQGKVKEFYLGSGKIDILKKSLAKLKRFSTADLMPLKGARNIRDATTTMRVPDVNIA